MYFQKLKEKYSFIYYDPVRRRNVRLKVKDTPHITTEKEALEFCREWERELDATKARIREKIEWQNKFYTFVDLLKQYVTVRKEEAPHSWQLDAYSLEYYIFPFFLERKSANNLNLWSRYYEEFRDYLLTVPPIKQKLGRGTLAYSTKNGVIKALNTFMQTMHRRRALDLYEKCRYFPKHKLNRKGEESVIAEDDQKAIFQELKKASSSCAVFFWIALHTGMRISEMIGLSLADFFAGNYKNKVLEDALKPWDLKSFGYISLESQPVNSMKPRSESGRVPRKPLKSKKVISHADSRLIPIFNRDAFNYLVGLWNSQQYRFQKADFGKDPKDYLLFDTLNKNTYSFQLREAQVRLKREKIFSSHDCRHTYSTWLAEKTGGNYTLCRLILGHASIDITLRYTHLSAQIHQNLRSKHQLNSLMEMIG